MSEPKPCGSLAAYWRHRRRGEEPCQACKTATTAHIRLYNKTRERAVQRLISENRGRFRELLAEERAQGRQLCGACDCMIPMATCTCAGAVP